MSLGLFDAYRWGKRSAERLRGDVEEFMRTGNVAVVAPYLTAPRRREGCEELKAALEQLAAWDGLRWAYTPKGPPPWDLYEVLVEILCREGTPLDEEFLKQLAPPEMEEAAEEGGE